MILGGDLFVRAADLTDHDDRLGRGIGLEERENIDERHAEDRVAADTDSSGLTDPGAGQRVHDLVAERTGARDDADRAGRRTSATE